MSAVVQSAVDRNRVTQCRVFPDFRKREPETSMPNIKYTERKTSAATSDPMPKEPSDGAGNAAMPDSPEEGEVGNSDTEEKPSVNPGGSSTKQFLCHYCSKSCSRVRLSNFYRHEQTIHSQTALGQKPGSFETIRSKKMLTAERH